MRLRAVSVGEGEGLVLLHGLFGRAQNLGALARGLAGRYRVVSLDLRNHGESPHAAGMSYETMAADVLETLDDLGLSCCTLLGHSMGGKVGMVAALTWPERISRLIVADIAPVAYRHSNKRVAQAMLALPLTPGLTRAVADAALTEAVPDPAIRGFLLQNLRFGEAPAWRIGLPEIAEAIRDIEAFPALSGRRYAGPVLFIRGGRSPYVKDKAWPAIEALFPRAVLATLPEAGHWLHADQPALFFTEIERFLLDTKAGG